MLTGLKGLLQTNNFPHFLRGRFLAISRGTPIQKLPLDVFVDQIFRYLFIEDILSLRRVNKAFFLLTHEPVIWKRFLERMSIPIPPLRPTFRYTMGVTDFEVEQLVVQAITADDNWRRQDPALFQRRSFVSPHPITSMFLLPGGKYMVVSVQNRDKTAFWFSVYMLDHPSGPRCLMRIPTFSEAYNLEASFMKLYEGEDGLIIAYVRRIFRRPQPKGMTPAHYSHKHHVDVPGGFNYEVVAMYTSLSMLELLSSPDLEQGSEDYNNILRSINGPFKELSIIACGLEVTQLSLFECQGARLLAMVLNPGELHFINLQNFNEKSTMIFKDHYLHPGKPHRIRAFRVYPGQADIVVIRSVSPRPGLENHLVEWHDLPKFLGTIRAAPRARYTLNNKNVEKFHISDYGLPGRTKLAPDHPTLQHTFGPPPPLSIYLELRNPEGVEHHAVYPKQEYIPATATKPATYQYTYDHDTYQMSTHLCSPQRAHVFAGSHRALLCMVDPEDRTDSPKILRMRRYIHPKNSGITYEPDPVENSGDGLELVLRKGRLPMPKAGVYRTIEAGDSLDMINSMGGAQAIAWDESTGRMVVAPKSGETVLILEASQLVHPDNRFGEWTGRQDYLFTPEDPDPMDIDRRTKGKSRAHWELMDCDLSC